MANTMKIQNRIHQYPDAGQRIVMFRGDTIQFKLWPTFETEGQAWIRTNIGRASITRKAVLDDVDKNLPPLGTDWFDIPMRQVDSRQFAITLPLHEAGHFEAKCFFMPADQTSPLWPEGHNTTINVEPANACCANIIYNAFVRQFGKNKDGKHLPDMEDARCVERLDRKEYTVIPRSGTFRDLIGEMDFITGKLGCRFVHLLPIHPTPTTYGRMGRFGSPYAALHFTGIDPALAVFDFKATPLDQFIELVDAVHARRARLIIDIAVNHTGWAASLHESHPHWLLRDAQGDIHRPGAWGVVWQDLTSLDYSQKDLWTYIARVFLAWCRRGVDGFRCDAGYMIPLPAWTYVIATVRQQFPETIFLLEGLGGPIEVTRDLLNRANFNWAYSELFQNYDRAQIENYLPEAIDISRQDGLAIHYAETHDNNRLAARSLAYAKMRTALCALCSQQGGFGFANGVEWFADVKINVHEARPLNWGNPVNQVDAIRRINILLRSHPAFFENVEIKILSEGAGHFIALGRLHRPSGKHLVVVANLDDEQPVEAAWTLPGERAAESWTDLLTETTAPVKRTSDVYACMLPPGCVLCLTPDANDLELLDQPENLSFEPPRLLFQKMKAKALDVFCWYHGALDLSSMDPTQAAHQLAENPVEFCRSMNPEGGEHRVIFWQWPRDLHRKVMLPPKHFLLISAEAPFRAAVIDGYEETERVICCEESLPAGNGDHFILFAPCGQVEAATHRTLRLTVYEKSGSRHTDSPLLYLGDADHQPAPTRLRRTDLMSGSHLFLAANGRGGMCRANIRWGKLDSKYDALLAANLHPRYPEDRWIMFTRCRAWTVYQGYSQEICFDNLDAFQTQNGRGVWEYKIPTGQGERIDLQITVGMIPGENTVRLAFRRLPADGDRGKLRDAEAVELILRPDIEDRNFHETTKAYMGPERLWPAAMTPEPDAFVFAPDPGRKLTLRISKGTFVSQPEWRYMVHRQADEERGLDPNSDLWSPGYFSALLQGGETVFLAASVNDPLTGRTSLPINGPARAEKASPPLADSLSDALNAFIVRRDDLKSVIAGYPWFLDWGRDSLIFTRGLIQTGMVKEAGDILKLFGTLENRGTLPNMIHGRKTGNRTTSDAPLWFAVACAELIKKEKSEAFLDERCGARTIKDILLSIGHSYREGTANHIFMDRSSGLIFSPACYTWMDTNHPACTPRRGYCIEIQALWHATLAFLSAIDPLGGHDWAALSKTVSQAIMDLFVLKQGSLSDCLHASADEPAGKCVPDDAIRPNQLLAVALDAVTDKSTGRAVLDACQALLIPGAIRSLDDAPIVHPLEIASHGALIHNPHYPYRGKYTGDEDTSRKPAYHNGTAWAWPFPVYCEAYLKVYGKQGVDTARALLFSSREIIREGCMGHFPEILDGDYPHAQKGCDAQAWGLSEWLRVWNLLKMESP